MAFRDFTTITSSASALAHLSVHQRRLLDRTFCAGVQGVYQHQTVASISEETRPPDYVANACFAKSPHLLCHQLIQERMTSLRSPQTMRLTAPLLTILAATSTSHTAPWRFFRVQFSRDANVRH